MDIMDSFKTVNGKEKTAGVSGGTIKAAVAAVSKP